jgi:SAM-dependent methyltransferase
VVWLPAVAERDHDIQNPTSPEKIRRLGEQLRLGPESSVLDIACGRGGPAIVLASAFGCRVVGIERAEVFVAAARERVAAAGLEALVEIREGDAAAFPLEPEAWDAALCLGASFVWGHVHDAAAALAPTVRTGGHVVVGEPYWRRWPLPEGVEDEGYVTLADTVERLERPDLSLVALIAASEEDWDRYRSLQWRAVEAWLHEHPDHADAADVRWRHESLREQYLEVTRELLGWAILAGVKR